MVGSLEGVTRPGWRPNLHTTAPEPPDFFTVEEAARVLRIGRTAAYALARRWRDTEGRQGLPVVPVGRLLRVPRVALEEMAGGSLTAASALVEQLAQPASEAPIVEPAPSQPRRPTTPRPRRPRSSSIDQPALPLT